MDSYSILSRIGSPADLAALSYRDLAKLSQEIRSCIVATVSRNGGHLASNLGVVELSIALHRVFDSPRDKIVWDVGHQCYAHKLLTGRSSGFVGLRRSDGISGFPKRAESEHDAFDTGHSATSISAALGLLAAERILGGTGSAVAVIGDGALTGGLAYEGLSHAGQLGLPLVVVLNDNKMSIGPNVGALSKYLSRLTMKARYQTFRRRVDSIVRRIPFCGAFLYDAIVRMKKGIKAIFYPENFFVDLGFEYVGPIDGHQIAMLEQVLGDARRLGKPVVVHVMTRKGKGYEYAEDDPSSFHGVTPFSVTEGLVERRGAATFTEAFGRAAVAVGVGDSRVVALTAAMEKGTGLSAFHAAFPNRFFDVGIAEQHETTFAAGMAARGLRPIVALYSTFAQRAMDQIIHDVAIQNLPVTFALDRAGFVPDDGETHQGLFDIALLRPIPNMSLLAPASGAELESMLRWAMERERPCVIRYPKASCPHELAAFTVPLEEGRGVFIRKAGASVLIAFTGSLYPQASEAADLLAAEGIGADLYNLRFLKPVDEENLCSIFADYELVVIAEEGVLSGGFGEYATALAEKRGLRSRMLALGAADMFPSQATRAELLAQAGLDANGIATATASAFRATGRFTVLRSAAR
jgi:1-deoxy-D-xylulose-5-phosphate synthase